MADSPTVVQRRAKLGAPSSQPTIRKPRERSPASNPLSPRRRCWWRSSSAQSRPPALSARHSTCAGSTLGSCQLHLDFCPALFLQDGFAAKWVSGRERCVLSSLPNAIYGALTVPLNALLPRDDTLSVYPTPDSSIFIGLHAPACRRIINHSFFPYEVISLIEAIFASKDEVKMIGYLRRGDAQTFIDVIHGILSAFFHFRDTV
jgi:hypothetical protein